MIKLKKWTASSICSFALLATRSAVADTPKPNVLVILVDDMGYGDTGFNGCKDIPTPHIDSIAENGVRFTAGYVTAPQCAPSRMGLLTGVLQNRFSREENYIIDEKGLPDAMQTFGDYMQKAGYRTGIVGKWHLGTMPDSHPCKRGFDWFYGHLEGWTWFFPPPGADSIPYILENYEQQKVDRYLTDVFGDAAIRFIEQKSDKPFFLYLSFNSPHGPLQAPEEYLKRFEHVRGTPFGIKSHYTGRFVAHPRRIYAAMVASLDDAVGRVLQALRDKGVEENTLICFLSDNGGPVYDTAASNGPLRGMKGAVLEGGLRVPFAMQWKKAVPAGQTVDLPVSSLDLLPTALAAATSPIPEPLDGIDLLPLLVKGEQLPERTLYWRFPFPAWQTNSWWAVRRGDWKLVYEAPQNGFTGEKGRLGLFRITEDLHEDHDLSGKYPEIRQKLQAEFDAWNASLPKELWTDRGR
jgi:arylsulfatase A-like enzyme